MRLAWLAAVCVPFLALVSTPASAQPSASPEAIASPPARALTHAHLASGKGADGRVQITAVRARTPIDVDGALDDEVWVMSPAASALVQSEPDTDQPASEPTDIWMAYDDTTLYVAAYCHEAPDHATVVNDIRKDFKSGDQDSFEVIIDTFGDRRDGFMFLTNPEGASSDQQVANEGREINASWDAVWFVRTQQVADGWTVEMAIPFKSLRFEGGARKPWGVNFSRRIRHRNEVDFWAPVPRAYALTRVSLAGTLAGLPPLTPGRNLRLKPFVAASATRNTGGSAFERGVDYGLDLKYGVTPALTLDVTVLPDFAQVEADEQQVNLTQFSQFFPEKREFFLENSGQFYVGDAARNNRVNPTPTPDEDLLLFFSRRIGLAPDGTVIPIAGGARVTGQAAGFGLGLLSLQTRESAGVAANNYTVLRGRRNVGRASDIGGIFMSRQSTRGGDYNRVVGADATVRFGRNLDWNTYFVHTMTPGVSSKQDAWRTSLTYESNFFHGKGAVMDLGDNFNDELGYYRRTGVRKLFLDTGVRPRPRALRAWGVRELHPHIGWNYYENHAGQMVGKNLHNGLTVFLENGGYSELSINPKFDYLTRPLRLHPKVAPLPTGGYGWTEYQIRYTSDPSRMISGGLTYSTGGLWSGTQQTANWNVTVRPSYKLRATFSMSRTAADLDVPKESFVTNLLTLRANYSFTTRMYLDSLLQYDRASDRFNANIRFNLMHHPLSDLFVVYNEQRITTPETLLAPGRGLILKFTQMFAF